MRKKDCNGLTAREFAEKMGRDSIPTKKDCNGWYYEKIKIKISGGIDDDRCRIYHLISHCLELLELKDNVEILLKLKGEERFGNIYFDDYFKGRKILKRKKTIIPNPFDF